MGLNRYRDEVAEFLDKIAAREEPVSKVMGMLDEEISLLKESLDDRERLSHQLYDVLFLLFEIGQCITWIWTLNGLRDGREKELST